MWKLPRCVCRCREIRWGGRGLKSLRRPRGRGYLDAEYLAVFLVFLDDEFDAFGCDGCARHTAVGCGETLVDKQFEVGAQAIGVGLGNHVFAVEKLYVFVKSEGETVVGDADEQVASADGVEKCAYGLEDGPLLDVDVVEER